MRIDFDEERHIYFVDGEIASISVTELLAKHGLAPSYAGVDRELLKSRAEYGKAVHKDLELYMNNYGHEPTTEECKLFSEWAKDNIECGVAEQKLAYEYNGMIIAGTADLMGFVKDNVPCIGDHKTTSAVYKESVRWQLSLLDYMARHLKDNKINGNVLKWKGAEKFYCFHYGANGEMKVIELEKVPDEEIEKLIDAEYHNTLYKPAELIIADDLREQIEVAENYLKAVESEYKAAEETAKELRAKLCSLMERQGIVKWEMPNGMKVTYVAQSERLGVDSAKLKKNYPQVYSECLKISKAKAYVRISEKSGEDEE